MHTQGYIDHSPYKNKSRSINLHHSADSNPNHNSHKCNPHIHTNSSIKHNHHMSLQKYFGITFRVYQLVAGCHIRAFYWSLNQSMMSHRSSKIDVHIFHTLFFSCLQLGSLLFYILSTAGNDRHAKSFEVLSQTCINQHVYRKDTLGMFISYFYSSMHAYY